jgi:hydantoinase/carbamoylase family amidase
MGRAAGVSVEDRIVDPARVVDALRELRALTGDAHGAQRLAWTPTWARAREWLRDRLGGSPVVVDLDEAGNLWATLPGQRPDSLVIGSHLDSIPQGGWLDGCLGVLAGAEVLRALAARGTPAVTLKLVDWADEEGVRFGGQSMYGSATVAGALDPESLVAARDSDGVRFADAARAFGVDLAAASRSRARLADVRSYLELHIEQGPVLEGLGLPLGVVTGAVGIERHALRLQGMAAHAGSTPMSARHDALCAGAAIALEARALAVGLDGRATTGEMTVQPGLATVIPRTVDMTVDLRHEREDMLADLLAQTREAAARIAEQEAVSLSMREVLQIAPTAFDESLIGLAADVVAELTERPAHLMPTGALHDAAQLAGAGVPAVMLFVRSRGGISHSPAEDTDPQDLELAVKALANLAERVLRRL